MDFYGMYRHARNAAWQALIDFNVTELPVSVSRIARQLSIPLIAYPNAVHVLASTNLLQHARQASGLALCIGGKWVICYDPDTIASGRARFTVAHELGHILLGHTPTTCDDRQLLLSRINAGDIFQSPREPHEQEADQFAARLLAPSCVLHALGATTPEAISTLCGLSRQAATLRAKRVQLLRQRGAWMTSALERRVYTQFHCFVKDRWGQS